MYYEALRAFETHLFVDTMEKAGWNVSEAARVLGIQRMKLVRSLKKYGISHPHHKPEG
jgi:DNA-binding NtrC family response regulator